jgi:hypothetical protein
MATPPLTAPAEWRTWLDGRTADETFLALLRLGALALGGYLLAATVACTAARACGAVRLASLVDSSTLPALRPLVRAMVGALVAASSVGTTTAAAAATTPPPTITLTRLTENHSAPPTPASPSPPAPPPPSPPVSRRVADPPRPATWRVARGASLWSIAHEVLSLELGRDAGTSAVATYWSALIESNRDLLRDRDNPHLIFPGQVFRLPERSAGGL